jgi:hypothetical protein
LKRVAAACLLALAGSAFAAAEPGTAGPVHEYKTEAGDTLIGLGRRLLVDPAAWPELQRLNRIRNPRRIPVGSVLRIPLRLMHSVPAPADVSAASGGVRSGGQPVTAGQRLAEGSELDTAGDGQVTVRLVDGTLLRLRQGGRLSIDESRRIPAAGVTRSGVRLEQGRVEVEARPARGGQPGFRIGTPQGVLGVRGTDFRVETRDGVTRSEVLEGVIAVSGSGAAAEQRLQAGFGTVIDAGGRVTPPSALLPAPDLSGLPALHERPLVRLALAAMPGAVRWRVQVARDESFDEVLADVQSATPVLRIEGLADGRYPMRLRAADASGLEGRDARATLVLKARPEPPLPRAPAPGAVIGGSSVQLAWAASSEARRYRLQLARTGAADAPFGEPVRDLKDLETLEQTLTDLPPGSYRWRLASVRADGDQGPFGDALGFELKALPPQVSPPAPPAVSDRAVSFFWQGLPGQRFDFQLARDPEFKDLVAERQVDSNRIELPLPGSGRFHVRLRARDADGFVGPWSASQYFDVIPCVRDDRGACVRSEGGALQRP